jgi:hypothetical protein
VLTRADTPPLHGGPVFTEAAPEDDAAIRRLLREHAMPGAVSVSLEREPSLRAGQELEGGEHRTLVCRDTEGGPIVAVGGVVTRAMCIGGEPAPVAYLTQLRLDHAARGKRRLIVDGYRHMGTLLRTRCVLTSILDNNHQARRLLERGLRGMPVYRFLSAFHTFVLGRRVTTSNAVRRLDVRDASGIARLLADECEGLAVAPAWSGREVSRLMKTGTLEMFGIDGANGLLGCVGMWDLSSVKQAVVRGYSRSLGLARGALNLAASALGSPRLPSVGEALRVRFLSHVAVRRCDDAGALALIGAACEAARLKGASLVSGAAPGRRPHGLLARHAWNTMRSRIYAVEWPANTGLPPTPSAWPQGEALLHLEVALL